MASAGLLAYAYYLQYVEGQDPCPLCLLQRLFYYGILIVLAVGALHAPRRAGQIAYAIGTFVFAAGGLVVATRHVYLQHLPPDQVPACGPDLYFMMENFPLSRTLQLLLRGTGQCAEVNWTMLGLSIAEWSFVWFVIFGILAVWLMVRKERGRGRMFG